ncbi:cytidine deaminase-like protein [Syncephalis plumigaleata]|nr:cytidine deaminase-like protein [Syncephalis plumigaleata]
MDSEDTYFMKLAIAEANKATPVETAYNVGALLVIPDSLSTALAANDIPADADRIKGNTHAEECCLLKLSLESQNQLDAAVSTATITPPITMYTTMEPCARRLSGRPSCTQRLLAVSWIQRIVVGVREPSTFVKDVDGIEQLRAAGRTVDILHGLEEACLSPNKHVI